MARQDNDINSGSTSFSILLGDAPHLDGEYTLFGELEKGDDVLRKLETTPRVNGNQPSTRLTVSTIEVK